MPDRERVEVTWEPSETTQARQFMPGLRRILGGDGFTRSEPKSGDVLVERREGEEVARRTGRHDVGHVAGGEGNRTSRPHEPLDLTLVERLGDECVGQAEHCVGCFEQPMSTEAGSAALTTACTTPALTKEPPTAAGSATPAVAATAEVTGRESPGPTLADPAAVAAALVAALASPMEVAKLELAPGIAALARGVSGLGRDDRGLARRSHDCGTGRDRSSTTAVVTPEELSAVPLLEQPVTVTAARGATAAATVPTSTVAVTAADGKGHACGLRNRHRLRSRLHVPSRRGGDHSHRGHSLPPSPPRPPCSSPPTAARPPWPGLA